MAIHYFPNILCFIVFYFCPTIIANDKFTSVQCESPVTGIYNHSTVLVCEYMTRSKKECNITWHYNPVNTTNWIQIPCASDNKNAQKQRKCHTDFKNISLIIEKTEISDKGEYQILLECGSSGHSFTEVKLHVKAPYTVPQITKMDQDGEKGLACTTLGYPWAQLHWQIENGTDLDANSTIIRTEDKLYHITSYISVVGDWCSVNYNCSICTENACIYARFECSKSEKTFQSPERKTRAAVGVLLSLGFIVLLALLGFCYWRNIIPQEAYIRARFQSTAANLIDDAE